MITIGLYIIGAVVVSTFCTLFYLEDRERNK